MGIKKQFLKSKPTCKVSFRVNVQDSEGAKSIQLLGNFNKWDESSPFMKELKSGDFTQTVELEQGKKYQFRYLIDGKTWTNDTQADSKVLNPFNEMNDVVSTFI